MGNDSGRGHRGPGKSRHGRRARGPAALAVHDHAILWNGGDTGEGDDAGRAGIDDVKGIVRGVVGEPRGPEYGARRAAAAEAGGNFRERRLCVDVEADSIDGAAGADGGTGRVRY